MLTRRRLLAVAGVIVALLAVVGAALFVTRDRDDGTAAPTKTDEVIVTDYVVKATGDVEFETSGKREVRVLTIRAADPQFRGVTLLSVGPPKPIADGAAAFRVAFDLTSYDGNGSYKIRAGSPRDLLAVAEKGGAASPPDQSNVLVQLWPSGDTTVAPEVFDKALQPCPLTTSDGGRRGTLRCPKVTNSTGKTFALEMRWGKK